MKISGKSLEVLMLLASKPGQQYSGYELGRELKISSGTLYPLLLKLEQSGMVEADWELGDPHELGRPRRRYHKINGYGLRALRDHLKKFDIAASTTQGLSWSFGNGGI